MSKKHKCVIYPPTLDDIHEIGEAVLARLPKRFRAAIADVPVRVEDFPDKETEAEMELESPFDLLGLYAGVDIGHRNSLAASTGPDMIFLYRRPIMDYWCESDENLISIVANVLIHEIGHHLGLSDNDMDRIEKAATR
ncbi:MAG: metallopeptidase family protein [Pseudomonadota bacterium]|nr:metallopeptidase family protein [Pseudomonadota bacterium]